MELEMAPTPEFNCGLDLAGLVVSSDLLHHSWDAISKLRPHPSRNVGSSPVSLEYTVSQPGNYRIIAFVASARHLQEGSDLVPSSDIPDFRFLRSKSNPVFSISRAAKTLFYSVCSELSSLKDQVQGGAESTPCLITGHSLGGSIASLFTLWLLDSLDPVTSKRPLCITFGAPLLGDPGFQQAISRYSTWNSCFLHAVHMDDTVPTVFPATTYRPFGTFLFLSGLGKACFEAPETISELLQRMKPERSGNKELVDFDYGPTAECLRGSAACKDMMNLSWRKIDSYKAGIVMQLMAIGLLQNEQQDKSLNKWVERNIVKPEKTATTQRIERFDPARKLNEVKVNMAQMEWYRKLSENSGNVYYDSYKSKPLMRDYKVVEFKRTLTDYWERLVEEVEKKPQKEEAHLRKRWLYAGTNFRRMVEPLDIADYYKVEGRRDYWTRGRLNCYRKLEKWLEEAKGPQVSIVTRKQNIKSILTEDSCFWAHVEEAIISCEACKKGDEGSYTRLVEFDSYVFGLIERYSVSPEIFIPESSFMKWWEEYESILMSGPPGGLGQYDSKLIQFMRKRLYHKYKEGTYDPLEDDEWLY